MQLPATITLPPRGLAFTLALMTLVLSLHGISSMLLTELGFAYEEPGGHPLTKVHPGTYLAFGLLVLAALMTGRPFAWIEQEVANSRGAFVLMIATVLIMAHAALFVRVPFTGFIDTLLCPLCVYFLFKAAYGDRARAIALAMHLFMVVNSIIGLTEYLTGWRLIPFWIEGRLVEGDWRSTALLGHPLSNASVTGTYLVALVVGGGRDLPQLAVISAFAINAVAMIAFGGRAATLLAILVIAIASAVWAVKFLRGARVSRLALTNAILLTPFIIAAVLSGYQLGFFERFIGRFIDDEGSAATRIGMFHLLAQFSFSDLLLVPDWRHIETYQYMFGLDSGIESFWISFILQYGIVMSLVVFVALFWFVYDVIRHSLPASWFIMMYFFAVASTSVSLNGKGTQLTVVVIQSLILLRRREVLVQVPQVSRARGETAPDRRRPAASLQMRRRHGAG